MPRFKVLITVTTYPLPSKSYDELVCTAGILEDGSWIRIYPVPFRTLVGKKRFKKYQWIEIDLDRKISDIRPESYSPKNVDLSDVQLLEIIDTQKGRWLKRKELCLKKVYESMTQLIQESKKPTIKSLATFKPTKVIDFVIEDSAREWKKSWIEQRKQLDLFIQNKEDQEIAEIIDKIPYKFSYVFLDDEGKKRKLMIEDWEIGELYRKCLERANGDETIALEKVKQKYKDEFMIKKDLYFFLGTTKQFHFTAKNPFVIIGVFYPPKEEQNLFNQF
jgi:hypothetical protein